MECLIEEHEGVNQNRIVTLKMIEEYKIEGLGKEMREEIEKPITMYMRFKEQLNKDDNGQPFYIDFWMRKFKDEFSRQA